MHASDICLLLAGMYFCPSLYASVKITVYKISDIFPFPIEKLQMMVRNNFTKEEELLFQISSFFFFTFLTSELVCSRFQSPFSQMYKMSTWVCVQAWNSILTKLYIMSHVQSFVCVRVLKESLRSKRKTKFTLELFWKCVHIQVVIT